MIHGQPLAPSEQSYREYIGAAAGHGYTEWPSKRGEELAAQWRGQAAMDRRVVERCRPLIIMYPEWWTMDRPSCEIRKER